MSSQGLLGQPPALGQPSILDLLHLERIEENLYRSCVVVERPWALYGGQVAAQALYAAGRTVPDGRLPHSLHGYFLRSGSAAHPTVFEVFRDRDGRSFSARRVVAVQDGEVIFNMSTSFHRPEPGADYIGDLPLDAPSYEGLEDTVEYGRMGSWLRVRAIPSRLPQPSGDGFPRSSRLWCRVIQRLADDPVVHACALAYMSDMGSGFAETELPGSPRGGASIDHSIWFQDPVRADEWVLVEMWPMKAGGARGLYAGSMRDAHGRLAGLLTQEMLIRPARI